MPCFPADAHRKGGQNAAVTNIREAKALYSPLLPLVVELKQRGLSLRAIARELEARGLKTRQEWQEELNPPLHRGRRVSLQAGDEAQHQRIFGLIVVEQ